MPTPTLGNAFITLLTVFWSGNENITDAKNIINNTMIRIYNIYMVYYTSKYPYKK